jgi:LysR family transcriptional regulator, regulator for bpeEF and oprC
MDKLRAIQFFCRTVEARSFAAASRELEVVPSALSKAISALERDLGFKLFSRSTRSVSLTDGGAAFYEQCRRILQDLEEAETNARSAQSIPKGKLRVGMHPGLRASVLSQLGVFLDQYSDVSVVTVMTNTPTAVVDEGLDIVLRVGSLPDSTLVSRRIGWTSPIVCASDSYVQRWGEPATPSELRRHRAIVYARGDEERNTRWEFIKGGVSEEVEVPVRAIVRDGIGLTDAAVGGCGVARPYDFSCCRLLASGQLRSLLPDWSSPRSGIYVVLPPQGSRMPAKVRAFIDFAQSLLVR